VCLQIYPSVTITPVRCKDPAIFVNRAALDVSTTLALINARNHSALLLFFAQIVGDYHKVMCTCAAFVLLQHGNDTYRRAVELNYFHMLVRCSAPSVCFLAIKFLRRITGAL
jgi:hypothetical protein